MTDISTVARELIKTDPALAAEVHRQISEARALATMNRVNLPPQQRQAFQVIQSFIAENNYPPSLADIAEHLGLASRSNVLRMVIDLEKCGLIERSKDYRRYISIREQAA